MILVKLMVVNPGSTCRGSFCDLFKQNPSSFYSDRMIGKFALSFEDIDRIIEMAWEDRTPFDAIEKQFGLPEKEVIKLMRREMKPSSFQMWRERVQGRKTKHSALQSSDKFKSNSQREITQNRLSKRY